MYLDSGREQFGLIEYFVFVQQRLIAIVIPLIPIQISCRQHYGLATYVLDMLSFLTPVKISGSIKCCFVDAFCKKCLCKLWD